MNIKEKRNDCINYSDPTTDRKLGKGKEFTEMDVLPGGEGILSFPKNSSKLGREKAMNNESILRRDEEDRKLPFRRTRSKFRRICTITTFFKISGQVSMFHERISRRAGIFSSINGMPINFASRKEKIVDESLV